MDEAFLDKLSTIDYSAERPKDEILNEIVAAAEAAGYGLAKVSHDDMTGGHVRFKQDDSERFVEEFFPEIDANQAQLASDSEALSPSILLVSPGRRLSWQYHTRLTKHWKFLTPGKYFTSQTDEPGDVKLAVVGGTVQLAPGERHRLVGMPAAFVIVAEVWSADPANSSSEGDLVIVEGRNG